MQRSLNKIHIEHCGEKLRCNIRTQTHPAVLHFRTNDHLVTREESVPTSIKHRVSSGYIETLERLSDDIGAGNINTILSIMPVLVKASRCP